MALKPLKDIELVDTWEHLGANKRHAHLLIFIHEAHRGHSLE